MSDRQKNRVTELSRDENDIRKSIELLGEIEITERFAVVGQMLLTINQTLINIIGDVTDVQDILNRIEGLPEIEHLLDLISDFKERIEALETLTSDHTDSIAAHEATLENMKNAIADIMDQIKDILDAIANGTGGAIPPGLENTLNDLTARVSSLETLTASLGASLTTLQAALTAHIEDALKHLAPGDRESIQQAIALNSLRLMNNTQSRITKEELLAITGMSLGDVWLVAVPIDDLTVTQIWMWDGFNWAEVTTLFSSFQTILNIVTDLPHGTLLQRGIVQLISEISAREDIALTPAGVLPIQTFIRDVIVPLLPENGGQNFFGPDNTIVFSTPGTYAIQVPEHRTLLFISGCGGGGGGAVGTTLNTVGGGGGSGGEGIDGEPFDVVPGQIIGITIGAGGNGGTGVQLANAPGGAQNGQATVVGGMLTLLGGNAGDGTIGGASVGNGSGAGGSQNLSGGNGLFGSGGFPLSISASGGGGGGAFGGGGGPGHLTLFGSGGFSFHWLHGIDAIGLAGAEGRHGGGGGGGAANTVALGAVGGRGGNGLIKVEWFRDTFSGLYDEYLTAGTYMWNVPAGVRQIMVTAAGAGGGGGSGGSHTSGAGGGGGAFVVRKLLRIPVGVTQIPITVGAGGLSLPDINSNGLDGGNTVFGEYFILQGGRGGGGGRNGVITNGISVSTWGGGGPAQWANWSLWIRNNVAVIGGIGGIAQTGPEYFTGGHGGNGSQNFNQWWRQVPPEGIGVTGGASMVSVGATVGETLFRTPSIGGETFGVTTEGFSVSSSHAHQLALTQAQAENLFNTLTSLGTYRGGGGGASYGRGADAAPDLSDPITNPKPAVQLVSNDWIEWSQLPEAALAEKGGGGRGSNSWITATNTSEILFSLFNNTAAFNRWRGANGADGYVKIEY